MPVAEKPQALQAIARANEIRLGRRKERSELRGSTAEQIEAALLNPSDAFASYPLDRLFAPGRCNGLLPRFGKTSLQRVLNRLIAQKPEGRAWDSTVKLGDLTEGERQRLVEALRPYLPKGGTR